MPDECAAQKIVYEHLINFINLNKDFFGGVVNEMDGQIWTPGFHFKQVQVVKERVGTFVVWSISFTSSLDLMEHGLAAENNQVFTRNWYALVAPSGELIDGDPDRELSQYHTQHGWSALKPEKPLIEHYIDLREVYDKQRAILINSKQMSQNAVAENEGWFLMFYDAVNKRFWSWKEIKEITDRAQSGGVALPWAHSQQEFQHRN